MEKEQLQLELCGKDNEIKLLRSQETRLFTNTAFDLEQRKNIISQINKLTSEWAKIKAELQKIIRKDGLSIANAVNYMKSKESAHTGKRRCI